MTDADYMRLTLKLARQAEFAWRILVCAPGKIEADPFGYLLLLSNAAVRWNDQLGVLLADVVPLVLRQFPQEGINLLNAPVGYCPFNMLAKAQHF